MTPTVGGRPPSTAGTGPRLEERGLGPRVALAVSVGVLAVANGARSTVVPSAWHLAFNLATGVATVAIGLAAGLRSGDLGLRRERVGAGARLGGVVFAVIAVGVGLGGLLGLVTDERADVSAGAMALRALVVIPLGTVLVEELAFRGVLHGLLVRVTTTRWAIVAGAVLFGLWHVLPAWRGGGVDAAADLDRSVTALGTFVATTAAGLGFGWLRVRSDSLVAPVLAHVATNSVTFAVAWAATS